MVEMSSSSVDWFFLRMAVLFGKKWNELYPPKRTRFVKQAKAEWAKVICEYDREFVERVAEIAKHKSAEPPTPLTFWALLRGVRSHDEALAPKPVPNREKGKAGLAAVRNVVGGDA